MSRIVEWRLLSIVESDEQLISGPGIEMLKRTIDEMAHRGAPVEENDYGFNKTDWNTYTELGHYTREPAIPARVATTFLRMLNRYKNTQVSNYEEISRLVSADFRNAPSATQNTPEMDAEKIHVYGNEPLSYGKVKVYIPHGVDLGEIRGINKIIDKKFEQEGANKEIDNYGNETYPRFKKFSKDRNNPNIVHINTDILKDVIDFLKTRRNIEVTGQFPRQISAPTSPEAGDTSANSRQEIVLLGDINTRYGRKLRVFLDVPVEKSVQVTAALRSNNLSPKGAVYSWEDNEAGRKNVFLVDIQNKTLFNGVRDVIASKGINVEPLDAFSRTHFGNPPEEDEPEENATDTTPTSPPTEQEGRASQQAIKAISFVDLPRNRMRVKVNYNHPDLQGNEGKKGFLRELVQYSFPEYSWDKQGFFYEVEGNYQQYANFGMLLKKFGYDVTKLREILVNKMNTGGLKKDNYHGQHDTGENYEKLEKDIEEKLPENTYELYDQQKQGVAFLYGRHHAILGDETGFGKCICKNSRIQTNHGVFTMQQLWEKYSTNIIFADGGEWADCKEDLFVHSMDEQEKIIKKQVFKLYRQKINAEVKEIMTSNGKKITATLPHKFYTLDGWKSEITANDYVCSSSNQFSLGINDFNNLDLARFLGWQISEGYENKNSARLNIFQNDENVLKTLKEIYDNMGFENNLTKENSKGNIKYSGKRDVNVLSITCRNYQNYLESLGYKWGCKSAEKQIPDFIMQANDEVAKAFLKSFVDAEGYVHPVCRQIEISSASKNLIYQLSLLLQRFNILCSFSECFKMATNGKKIKRKYYRLYICGDGVDRFFESVGLNYDYKNKSYYDLTTKPNSNKNGKPLFQLLRPFFDKYNFPYRIFDIPSKNYITGKRWASNETIKKVINKLEDLQSGKLLTDYLKLKKSKWTDKTLSAFHSVNSDDVKFLIKNLEKLSNNDLQYEKIESLEIKSYNDYVYDLSIDGTHNYIAENLICHNTVQLITAAALRMKTEIHPTLIISLKSTQQQWIDTIKAVCGSDEDHNISIDGAQPKKWTVLYYENFSAGKKLPQVIEACKNAKFGIAILDELHKLKHETSKRSKNIADVIDNVPTVWGASATVSANKPMDVKNQLRIVKHHLGKVSDSKFKKDFAGQKPTGYNNAYEEGDEDSTLEAAERLNRWLNLSGLYVRRSKEDLREMPALNRQAIKPTGIDSQEFERKFQDKVSTYKDPNLPISKMIAAREVIAQLKTGSTVNKVVKIITDNMDNETNNYAASKVVVFTNFIESANQLVSKLSAAVRVINPQFKVITYLANTKKNERSRVKANFTNDPNAKVLVMSMKMGGTGIDFPNAAQHMVINDFDWTPESAEQSEGRIYRINTNHPVNIDYTIANGIDESLFEKVQEKRKIAAIVQKYRKEYHQKDHDPETLNKIIAAQKQLQAIDDEMSNIIANQLPSQQRESFRSFLTNDEAFRKALFTVEA